MHSHNTGWSGVFYLAAGVTNVRDLGNNNEELLHLVDQLDGGVLPGPRIVRAGFLEGRSPYSARYGLIAETQADAVKDVHWYADRGYRQIKIYNSMNPDWVAPLAREAHRLGLGVTGHVPAFSSPDALFKLLPEKPEHQQPKYVAQDVFGYSFLSDVFMADYKEIIPIRNINLSN